MQDMLLYDKIIFNSWLCGFYALGWFRSVKPVSLVVRCILDLHTTWLLVLLHDSLDNVLAPRLDFYPPIPRDLHETSILCSCTFCGIRHGVYVCANSRMYQTE